MSRRTAAGLTALALLIGFAAYGFTQKVDYVTFRPGPTVDVLGKNGDGKDIIRIEGRRSYRDDGGLRLVTVYQSRPESEMTLTEMLFGWADPDIAVIPRSAVFKEKVTDKQVQQQSAAEMTSSQDRATAAALSAAGIEYGTRLTGLPITEVPASGVPASGKLEAGDLIVAVDGRTAPTVPALIDLIANRRPGSPVAITVERAGKEKTVELTTIAAADDPQRSRIGIALDEQNARFDFDFPFTVDVDLDENIGGPSAGMMFALTIYDLLTPGSITGGKIIAGSGEISSDGVVGPIGGIGQKIAGAQRDGARLFLVAEENCAEAASAHYDKDKIRLVKVHTLDEAIEDVEAWSKNSDAELPGCA